LLYHTNQSNFDKGSIIITSSLTFERWSEVFNDTVLSGALVDRIVHKAHILDISRDTSYRFEETIAWLKKD
jgi:DNA replication protein DnaC